MVQPGADPSQIKLSACVWGNFDGPGWIVYHVVPWPKGSKAEVGPDGGRVFVREDGTIAATDFGEGLERVDVKAIDLDGDGTDEIVEEVRRSAEGKMGSDSWLVIKKVDNHALTDIRGPKVSAGGEVRKSKTGRWNAHRRFRVPEGVYLHLLSSTA